VEYLNSKYDWHLDRKVISSIMTTIHGVDLNVRGLAETYNLDPDLGECLSYIFSEKRYSELYRSTEEERRPDVLIDLDSETTDQTKTTQAFASPKPSAKAFAEVNQPSAESFEWMAKYYKITGSQLLGLYAVLRGANKYYTSAVRDLTQKVLRRMRVDETYTDFVSAVSIWLVSTDATTIGKAQDRLKMQESDADC
jgi:hypothetical protein